MVFKIIISPRAQLEIEEITDYYFEISHNVLLKFYEMLEGTYEYLKINPYFKKRYENLRAIPIFKFPYLLFYTIDQDTKTIKILSCFHTSRSTKKYPK